MSSRMRGFIAALLAGCALAVVAVPVAAHAQGADTTDTYVVHGIPGAPVDVYLDGELALPDFQPRTIAGPLALPSGCCPTVSIFAAGTDPLGTAPLIERAVALPGGNTAASLVAHLSAAGNPKLTTFFESQIYPSAGNGKLAIRHTAALGPVDVYLGIGSAGARLTRIKAGLVNGRTTDSALPAGNYRVIVTPAGGSPSRPALTAVVRVEDQTSKIAYAIGDPGEGTLGLLTQTLTPAAAPPAPGGFPSFPSFPAFPKFPG